MADAAFMQYRSRQDIVAAILEIAKNGTIKTRIMYRAFLSYPQMKDYLDLMLENNLLGHDEGEKVYSTTAKRRQFLDMYKKMDNMVPKANMLTRVLEGGV
jgi:predicted transcriptional regulator